MSRGAARRPGLRRAVLLAASVAVLLRLAFGLGYWVGKPLTHDEHEYLDLGRNIARGQGFSYTAPEDDASERFGRAPLYPLLVAGVSRVAGGAALPTAVRIAQCAIGGLTVWLLALVAGRLGGDRAAVATAWLAAVYPPLVWICAYLLSEPFYMALAWANVLVLMPVLDEPGRTAPVGWRRLVMAGLVGGLAALTRPAHLFFMLLVGVCLAARGRFRDGALVAIGALLVIAPWTARNYAAYDRFVLIASEGGVTFWTGNHPLSSGEGDMAANPAVKQDNRRFRDQHPGLSPEALEPLYYREALGRIASRPAWWLGLEARKFFYLWVPAGPSYTLHSRLYLAATWVSYGLLLPLGAAGLLLVWRSGPTPVTVGLLLASAVLVCLVFLPQERFRLPVIDPALLVGAGALPAVRAARRHA